MKRVKIVKANRELSTRPQTVKLARTPWLFGERRQPNKPYILIPRHSSETREFVPMAVVEPTIVAGDACVVVESDDLYHLGVLQSTMHMAWMRQVCGQIKSDFRYSNEIVYNNFPWPQEPTPEQMEAVRAAAKQVLDTRAAFKHNTLADLYDVDVMPPALLTAHQNLNKAVDACYRPLGSNQKKPKFDTDLSRVRYLFECYAALIAEGQMSLSLRKSAKPRQTAKPAKHRQDFDLLATPLLLDPSPLP